MTRALTAILALAIGAAPAAPAQSTDTPAAVDPLAPLPDEPMEPASEAKAILDWVHASGDNGPLPYMVIDKVAAEIFVFDAGGRRLGSTPVLIGSAKGDYSAPGIGERELRQIPPEERTTPAGRFIAQFGHASGDEKVIWVDWTTAVSLHAVVTTNKREHRLQRLASITPDDNRITYGCINVPAAFYSEIVAPLLADTAAVVYILPEEHSLKEVFWDPSAAQSGTTQ